MPAGPSPVRPGSSLPTPVATRLPELPPHRARIRVVCRALTWFRICRLRVDSHESEDRSCAGPATRSPDPTICRTGTGFIPCRSAYRNHGEGAQTAVGVPPAPAERARPPPADQCRVYGNVKEGRLAAADLTCSATCRRRQCIGTRMTGSATDRPTDVHSGLPTPQCARGFPQRADGQERRA